MGRGLGAILGEETKSKVNSASDSGARGVVGNILEVALDDIFPNANQPRLNFDEKALQELANSIKNLGIIQPITLRKEGSKFMIISGERRYKASKLAGLKTIPAYIRLVNDRELLEMALVENIQRQDLDPIEVALTYQRLIDEIGITQEDLSSRIGKERSTITNSLRLLRLSPEIQNSIRNDEISAGHGRALLGLTDLKTQEAVFDKIVENQLNVRQTEALVNKVKKDGQTTHAPKEKRPLPRRLQSAQQRISDSLDLNVEIKSSGRGKKGKIILNFTSEEELQRVLNALEK